MSSAAVSAPPLWRPSDDQIADATLTRFTEFVRTTRGVDAADYHQLWQWSVTDLDGFWSAVWEFFGLHTVSGYDRVLAEDTMPHTQWFPGRGSTSRRPCSTPATPTPSRSWGSRRPVPAPN